MGERMRISEDKHFSADALKELFTSVGWELEINPAILQSAMLHSSHVLSMWEGDKLIGLIRSMDDDCWSANIDCLVVHKDYQSKGIATQLIKCLIDKIGHIEYISVSPNESKNFGLYENCGFHRVEDGGLLQIVKSNK